MRLVRLQVGFDIGNGGTNMIWTIDYCVERYAKDTSLMGFACGRRCLQKYEPCIYSVDNDMLSIKGIGCHIDIDFQTNEIIHYLDREIAMEDVRADG